MLFAIFSLVFAFFALLFFLFGMRKGKKYTWLYALTRIASAIGSAVLSMVLCSFLGKRLAVILEDVLGDVLPAVFHEATEALPTAGFALRGLLAMIIAPLLFVPVFIIIYNVINIFVRLILKLLVRFLPRFISGAATPEEVRAATGKRHVRNMRLRAVGKNPVGKLLGGVCGLVLFGILLVPCVCGAVVLDGAVSMAKASLPQNEVVEIAADVVHNSAYNLGSYAVRNLGGQYLYNGMTTYEENGLKVQLEPEIKLVAAVAKAAVAIADENATAAEAATAVREIEAPLAEAQLIPQIGAEFLNGAVEAWEDGDDFIGVEKISLGEYDELTDTLTDAVDHGDRELLKKDLASVIHVVALMIEEEASLKEPTGLIRNRDLTEGVLFELLNNERLSPVVVVFYNISVDMMQETLGWKSDAEAAYHDLCAELSAIEDSTDLETMASSYRKVFDRYGVAVEDDTLKGAAKYAIELPDFDAVAFFAENGVVSAETMAEKSVMITADMLKRESLEIADKEKEAEKLADALSVLVGVLDRLSGDEAGTTQALAEMGPALDALAATELMGAERTANLMTAILQSEKVIGTLNISLIEATDIANNLNENATLSSYASQTKTVAQSIDAVQSASTGDAKETIRVLLEDLTPESASTMQSILTPSVVQAQGVPEKNAKPAANMMSDMFGNLSDAKKDNQMDDAQLEKETAAVNNMMTMAMNAGESNGQAFGEGSVTGTSAKGFVDELMDSQVVSKTLLDQVYTEESDEPKVDPLATERNLSEDEQTELVNAINEKWSTATDEEKADGSYEKKLTAIAAVLNIPIVENESGVFEVVAR